MIIDTKIESPFSMIYSESYIGTPNIEVSLNKVDHSERFNFERIDKPVVFDINPKFGPAGGGNKLTVYGSNFHNQSNCLFGKGTLRKAIILTSEKLFCTIPSHSNGAVSFQIVVADMFEIDFTNNNTKKNDIMYTYIRYIVIEEIFPKFGK